MNILFLYQSIENFNCKFKGFNDPVSIMLLLNIIKITYKRLETTLH